MAQSGTSTHNRTGVFWDSGLASDRWTRELPSARESWSWDPSSAAEKAANSGAASAPVAEEEIPDGITVPLPSVLSAWRGVELKLQGAARGSPEWQRLSTVRAALRDTYHRIVDERYRSEEES